MEISIGKTIKKLRTEKGVTQEELAKYLNITFQSVSKWENEAATPDTMMLPKIAIFFGVSIDDLFSTGDINHFERVDKILYEPREKLNESNFLYVKRYLVGLLEENPKNIEALRRIIDLYKKRIDSYAAIAAQYAEQAINISPDNDNFNFILSKIADEKNRVLLKCDMLIRLNKIDETCAILDKLLDDYKDDPQAVFNIAERYDKIGGYKNSDYKKYNETAEQLYDQSQKIYDSMMSQPYMESIYHRAFMYDRWGKYEKAIEMWEEIMMRNKRDYNSELEGEDNKWPREMIESLKNKIAQREQD